MTKKKPCPKCGSTNWWCDCCPACGGVHHLRDCPNPIIGKINMKPAIEGLEKMAAKIVEQEKQVQKTHAEDLKPLDMPEPEPYPYPTTRVFELEDREMQMEKLGVQVDNDKTKTASTTKTCPECGAELLKNTNVPQCPNCGTRPWEPEPKER